PGSARGRGRAPPHEALPVGAAGAAGRGGRDHVGVRGARGGGAARTDVRGARERRAGGRVSAPAIEPLREDELAALPIFPLPSVVLFPGSVLPLHVFEPRYRAMMEDCVSRGPRAMAVALLRPGWERDYEGRPPVYEIAGAGRIVEWARRPDGRF